MLRKIRLTLAVLFFAAITLLFLDFTGTVHAWLGWTAKLQFLPAVLALNAEAVVFLLLLTLVFGRVYCSVICPLGVMQDVAAWFGKKQKKEPLHFLSCQTVAARRCADSIYSCNAGRSRFAGSTDRSLQFVRTDSGQPLRSALRMVQQPAGLFCRTCRQLCLLRNGSMAEECADFRDCGAYLYYNMHAGVAERTDILQHNLSGRNRTGILRPVVVAEACD